MAALLASPCSPAAADELPGEATSATALPVATYNIDSHVFAASAAATSGNPCYRLQATLAEPVAGYASSNDYVLSAGFRAGVQQFPHDDLFFSSFEACP